MGGLCIYLPTNFTISFRQMEVNIPYIHGSYGCVCIYIAAGASNLNDLNDILFFLDFVLVKKTQQVGGHGPPILLPYHLNHRSTPPGTNIRIY